MDYFLLKQSGTVSIPKASVSEASDPLAPSVRVMDHVDPLDKI